MGQACTKAGREEAAFLRAAKEGDCAAVHQAITRRVDWGYKAQTWNGQSVFHLAARYGRLDVLEAVVDAVRFNPAGPETWKKLLRMGHSTDAILKAYANLQDARCQTPLHIACIYGHAHVAAALMKLGATPWTWDELGGRTPLHYAASMGHVDVIRAVISVNTPPPTGDALRRPNTSRTRLVDICNDSGYTPLHYAVWAGATASIRALVSFEASLSARNVACGSDWVVSCLKCTPLHLAAHKGSAEVVKLLLSAYVQSQVPAGSEAPAQTDRRRRDPRRHVNANRQLAYHVAVSRGHNHLAELLHPDVPFSFILTPAEMEATARMYGVSKLAVLAAKALQAKLVAEIDLAVAAMAKAGGGGGTGSTLGPANRTRSGSIAALSGAVAAAAVAGSAAGGGESASQQVLAAAAASLRASFDRPLHGSNSLRTSMDRAGPGAAPGGAAAAPTIGASGRVMSAVRNAAAVGRRISSGQVHPQSQSSAPAPAAGPGPAPAAQEPGQAQPGPGLGVGAVLVAVRASQDGARPVAAAPEAGAEAAVQAVVAAGADAPKVVVAADGKAAVAAGVAPGSNGSSESAGDSERSAMPVDPLPDLTRPPKPAAAPQASPPPAAPAPAEATTLPLPPAPIAPFFPPPTFNEGASAFAAFAAEGLDDPTGAAAAAAATGGRTGGDGLRHMGSSSITLGVLARRNAAGNVPGGANPSTRAGGANAAAGEGDVSAASVTLASLARSQGREMGRRGDKGSPRANAHPNRTRSLRSLLTGGRNRRAAAASAAAAATAAAATGTTPQTAGMHLADPSMLDDDLDPDDLDDILSLLQPRDLRDLDDVMTAAPPAAGAGGTPAAAEADNDSQRRGGLWRSLLQGTGGGGGGGGLASPPLAPAAMAAPSGAGSSFFYDAGPPSARPALPVPPAGAAAAAAAAAGGGTNRSAIETVALAAAVSRARAMGGAGRNLWRRATGQQSSSGAAVAASGGDPTAHTEAADGADISAAGPRSQGTPLRQRLGLSARGNPASPTASPFAATPARGPTDGPSRGAVTDGGVAPMTMASAFAVATPAAAAAGASPGPGLGASGIASGDAASPAAAAAAAAAVGPAALRHAETLDVAVAAMLANLAEAPQAVLRRYRLLQLTHGLDLQDILRDHSDLMAATASALPTVNSGLPAVGGTGGGGGGSQYAVGPLNRTRSDATAEGPLMAIMAARSAAAVGVPAAATAAALDGSVRSVAPAGKDAAAAAAAAAGGQPTCRTTWHGDEGGAARAAAAAAAASPAGTISAAGPATTASASPAAAAGAAAADPCTASPAALSLLAAAAAANASNGSASPAPPLPTSPSPEPREGSAAAVSPFAAAPTDNGPPSTASTRAPTAAGMGAPASGAHAVVASAASATQLAGQMLRTLSSRAASESGEGLCGVCFDQPDYLAIKGCGHRLCAACSRELCNLNTFKPALCPFCRGFIGGFSLLPHALTGGKQ